MEGAPFESCSRDAALTRFNHSRGWVELRLASGYRRLYGGSAIPSPSIWTRKRSREYSGASGGTMNDSSCTPHSTSSWYGAKTERRERKRMRMESLQVLACERERGGVKALGGVRLIVRCG